ncbi:MAG: 16S rRNA (cytidine(1402)-2'-O)-methyltransferase [Spirochaetota bacterium]
MTGGERSVARHASGHSGTLYVVSTPIGNLADVTLRALEVLRAVDLVACEDTRVTLKLLNHHGIKKRLLSFHARSGGRVSDRILEMLREGASAAYVTDSGTPTVSDPGGVLVARVLEAGLRVVPVPGPSAVHAALAASGIPFAEYFFIGFLSSKRSRRRRRLQQVAGMDTVLVVYESPHRILAFLQDALEVLGDLQVCVSREITKRFETHYRGRLSQVLPRIQEEGPRGEYTVVLDARRSGEK